jgi:hypothetical protein
MGLVKPLEATALYRRCDPTQFTFETTADLADLTEVIGQARAVEAVRFGIGIHREGFNLFALGPEGTGKYAVVHHYLDRQAAIHPPPSDWCYINNFVESHKPCALRLPPGGGPKLRRDMERLVEELRTAIPATFESEHYRARRQEIEEEFRERQDRALADIQRQAQERGLALMRTPMGLAFAPMRGGQVISPEDFQKLPPEEQERAQANVSALQEELQKSLGQMPQWDRERRTKVNDLDQEVGRYAVGHLIEELRRQYHELPEVVDYLARVQRDVMENLAEFRRPAEAPEVPPPMPADGALRRPLMPTELSLFPPLSGQCYRRPYGHHRRAGDLRRSSHRAKSGRTHRAHGAAGSVSDRLQSHQSRGAASCERWLLDPRSAQSLITAICLGGTEARSELRGDPH